MAKIEVNSAVPYASPEIVVDNGALVKVRSSLIKDVQEGKLPRTRLLVWEQPYNTDLQAHLYVTAYGWGGLSINKNLTKI